MQIRLQDFIHFLIEKLQISTEGRHERRVAPPGAVGRNPTSRTVRG